MPGLEDLKAYSDRIRATLPAEATGCYIAGMQYYNNVPDRLPTETVDEMKLLFAMLFFGNLFIYFFVRKIRNVFLLGYVSAGFFLWCVTVDMVRANEVFPEWASYFPVFLLMYTFVSSFVPKES